ncbi:hypothetical protein F4802DRAFT_561933 [Xylaria palmicola]|nr:hypothetical protein F4802DRAFT_561933 [Xylaria palmicola]
MLSLAPLRRSSRATTGAGVRGQANGSPGDNAQPKPNEVRGTRPTKKGFLRGLITTSKAKLGGRQDNSDGGSRNGHDAERTASGTVSETSSSTLRKPRTKPDLAL